MREIKFRLWNNDTKCMYADSGLSIALGLNDAVQKALENNYIIMQYTGLKDKNGKEIYEGDILNSKNDGKDGCDVWDYKTHVNLIVRWNEKYAHLEGLPDHGEWSVHSFSRIEIIGNIHENPDFWVRSRI